MLLAVGGVLNFVVVKFKEDVNVKLLVNFALPPTPNVWRTTSLPGVNPLSFNVLKLAFIAKPGPPPLILIPVLDTNPVRKKFLIEG